MTPADICEACPGCRSIHICRTRCGLILEPGRETDASAPASRNGMADIAAICVAISVFVGLTGALVMSVVGSVGA